MCSFETQIDSDENKKENELLCNCFRNIEIVSRKCRISSSFIIEKEIEI